MTVLVALLVLAVLYLWHRIDRLESRLTHDERDFASRLEELASEIPDDGDDLESRLSDDEWDFARGSTSTDPPRGSSRPEAIASEIPDDGDDKQETRRHLYD